MKKRKKYYQILIQRFLISLPILALIIGLSTVITYVYAMTTVDNYLSTVWGSDFDSENDDELVSNSNFADISNFLKFKYSIRHSTVNSALPGSRCAIYWNDSDGNVIVDTDQCFFFYYTATDSDYGILERDCYTCDAAYLKQFPEMEKVINSNNEFYCETFLEYISFRKRTEYNLEIIDGYLDENTKKFYPGKCRIARYDYLLFLGDNMSQSSLTPTSYEVVDLTPADTTGLRSFRSGEDSSAIFFEPGSNYVVDENTGAAEIHRFALFAGGISNEEYFDSFSGKDFSTSFRNIIKDANDDKYTLNVYISVNFWKVYGSFIILFSILYLLIDIFVCAIVSVFTANRLKYFYKNEDYRKALMNSMAHDLKTPLTVISGYAENLNEDVQSDKRERYAGAILVSTEYMNGIINDILSLSRLEEEGSKKNLTNIDFCETSKAQSEKISYLIEEKNITLSIEGSFIKPAEIASIERVMDNLLNNAAKYTKEGGKIKVYAKDNNTFVMENTPIEPINVKPDKLWEPFVKGDESRGENNGTGLGLSIVKSILDNLGYKSKIVIKDGWFKVIIK